MVKCFVCRSRTVVSETQAIRHFRGSIALLAHYGNILRLWPFILFVHCFVLIFMFVWDVYLLARAFAHMSDNTQAQCTPSLSSYL